MPLDTLTKIYLSKELSTLRLGRFQFGMALALGITKQALTAFLQRLIPTKRLPVGIQPQSDTVIRARNRPWLNTSRAQSGQPSSLNTLKGVFRCTKFHRSGF